MHKWGWLLNFRIHGVWTIKGIGKVGRDWPFHQMPSIKSKPRLCLIRGHHVVYSCYVAVKLLPHSHCLPESICVLPLMLWSHPVIPKLTINIWLFICARIYWLPWKIHGDCFKFPKDEWTVFYSTECGPSVSSTLLLRNAQVWKAHFSRDKAQNSSESCLGAKREFIKL